MLENLDITVYLTFFLAVILTIYFFYKATPNPRNALLLFGGWLILHGIVGYSLFYTVTVDIMPPRFFLLFFPTLVLMIVLFNMKSGRQFIDSLDIKWLTLLHTVRIPVEFCLLWLFLHGSIPEVMTFEGRNFDILAGLTAPIVYYFGFVKNKISRVGLLIWNVVCLGLLLTIVIHAVLAAPLPFQQIAFDQPNIGVLYFPFVWLPSFIVPVVMFSHFVVIRRFLKKK